MVSDGLFHRYDAGQNHVDATITGPGEKTRALYRQSFTVGASPSGQTS
jgi:hypothetical protein